MGSSFYPNVALQSVTCSRRTLYRSAGLIKHPHLVINAFLIQLLVRFKGRRFSVSAKVKETIISLMHQIAGEDSKILPPLSDDLPLLETGLNSLNIAILVARLEEVLQVDPFSAADAIDVPVTLGEFIRFYEDTIN